MRNVLVKIVTGALGDSIGAMPAISAFQQREGCNVHVSTKWKHILKNSYPNLIFEESVTDHDEIIHIDYHFDQPLQLGFARDLGFVDWEYIRPKVDFVPKARPINAKYVAIGIQSTAQCKYWNYPDGWNILCKMLRKLDLTPVCIDQHELFGIKEKMNEVPKSSVRKLDNPIEVAMNYIHHAEFFIGISSGLSWVAHAMGKKVVMISGTTLPWNEFSEDCVRIINRNSCHGCFHEVNKHKFDAGDWLWCPEHKNTSRQFECTTTITPEMVIEKIREGGLI
jgi:autotransporter strand-loop-strand O-heptosyltransferase